MIFGGNVDKIVRELDNYLDENFEMKSKFFIVVAIAAESCNFLQELGLTEELMERIRMVPGVMKVEKIYGDMDK